MIYKLLINDMEATGTTAMLDAAYSAALDLQCPGRRRGHQRPGDHDRRPGEQQPPWTG